MTKIGWYATLTFTGTLLGAGFGSGRELWQFFARFGNSGALGVLLATLLFILLAMSTIYIARFYQCQNHQDFLRIILPSPVARLADWLFCAYLLAATGIMLSAGGTMAKEYLGVSAWWGVVAILIPTFLAVAVQTEGVFFCQKVLVPLLVLGIMLVTIAGFRLPAQPADTINTGFAWAGNSILYVSYNMLSGIAILVGLTNAQPHNTLSPKVGRTGGLLVGLLALLPVLALIRQGETAGRYDLPLLYLAYRQSGILFYIYGALFAGALLTTAISNTYCLCRRFTKPGRPWILILTTIMLLSLPLAQEDFPTLIAGVYGTCGILGLLLLPPMAWHCYKIKKRRDA